MNPSIDFTPNPAYTAQTVATKMESALPADVEELVGFIQNGHLLLWQFHGVFCLPIVDGKAELPKTVQTDLPRHLVRARAFGKEKEWHVWRTDKGLKGRKRWDGVGQAMPCVKAKMPLRGVIVDQLHSPSPQKDWVLHTRNYIAHNDFFQAGYVDQRFVNIEKLEAKP